MSSSAVKHRCFLIKHADNEWDCYSRACNKRYQIVSISGQNNAGQHECELNQCGDDDIQFECCVVDCELRYKLEFKELATPRPEWQYNENKISCIGTASSGFMSNIKKWHREPREAVEQIINRFKSRGSYNGHYLVIKTPGSGCDGAWDDDIYLYVRADNLVYRYLSNDCSCNGFSGEEFANSEMVLNAALYEREPFYIDYKLPKM